MGGISSETWIMKGLLCEKIKAKENTIKLCVQRREESHHGWRRLSKKEDLGE